MDQSPPGISEPVEVQQQPDMVVLVTRQPYDDYFHLAYEKDGRKVTEELMPDETRQWFKDHGITDKIGLEKSLDECWNFYETRIRIPGNVYKEPQKPFPAFQPQV